MLKGAIVTAAVLGLTAAAANPALAGPGHAGTPDHPVAKAASGLPRGSVTLIDTRTDSRGATVPVGKLPGGITLTPDGKTAYVLNALSYSVSVVRTGPGGTTSRTIKAGRYPIGIAMTPNGNRVFVTRHQNSGSGSVLPVKVTTGVPGQPVSPPPRQGFIMGAIAVAPGGRTVYAAEEGSAGWEGLLPIRTAGDRRGSPIKLGRFPYGIQDMAFTPDSKTLYVLGGTSKKMLLTPVRTATGKAGRPLSLPSPATAMVMTPDGRFVYVSDLFRNVVTVVRTATNRIVARVTVNDALALAAAPDGKTVYVGGADPVTGAGEVFPVSTATNTAGAPIQVSPDGDLTAIAVTPDGTTAYAALGFNDEVVPIDTATRTAQTPIPVGVNPSQLAVTRDGSTLYVVNSPDSPDQS
jgi:YVTN family beta-propeller protein